MKPKHVLLLDGIGAMGSATLLGIVLPRYQSLIGMPLKVLYPLAGIAIIFMLFSLTSSLAFPNHRTKNLQRIAIFNMLYCCLTMGFIIAFINSITLWGHLYFVGEIFFIILLARFELKVVKKQKG